MSDDVTPAPRRSGRVARIAAVSVGGVLAAFVLLLATRDSAVTRAGDSPLLGAPAPPIDGVTIDGDEFRLDDLRGRWVVVNYFATWCVPCRIEHPELISFTNRHLADGQARVVSVLFDEPDPDRVVRFFEREGGDWPVVVDDGSIALSYGVAGIPESFLVDPDGFVVSKLIGGITADQLDGLIAAAAAGRDGGGA